MKEREPVIRWPEPDQTDQEIDRLVDKARQDPEAFGEIYELLVRKIFAYTYSRVENAYDAEDITGRVFLRALAKLESYQKRPGIPFQVWLFRIAHNVVANFRRDEARRRTIPLDYLFWADEERDLERSEILIDKSDSPEQVAIDNEARDRLLKDISELSEGQRELLILKYNSGFTDRETAMIMETTEGAIKSRHHRILEKLREMASYE